MTLMTSAPCNTPDAIIEPTIRPPGSRKRCASHPASAHTAISTARCIRYCGSDSVTARTGGKPPTPANPNAAGSATISTNSRTVCTVAIRRTSHAVVRGEQQRLAERARR